MRAFAIPAPIAIVGYHYEHWHAQRTGEVGDRGVHSHDRIEPLDQARRAAPVVTAGVGLQIGNKATQAKRIDLAYAVADLQRIERDVGDLKQRRQRAQRH